jgi:hypothetical protein
MGMSGGKNGRMPRSSASSSARLHASSSRAAASRRQFSEGRRDGGGVDLGEEGVAGVLVGVGDEGALLLLSAAPPPLSCTPSMPPPEQTVTGMAAVKRVPLDSCERTVRRPPSAARGMNDAMHACGQHIFNATHAQPAVRTFGQASRHVQAEAALAGARAAAAAILRVRVERGGHLLG